MCCLVDLSVGRAAVQHPQSLLEVSGTQADGCNVLFVGTCIGHDPKQACIAMPDVAPRVQSGLSGMWVGPFDRALRRGMRSALHTSRACCAAVVECTLHVKQQRYAHSEDAESSFVYFVPQACSVWIPISHAGPKLKVEQPTMSAPLQVFRLGFQDPSDVALTTRNNDSFAAMLWRQREE